MIKPSSFLPSDALAPDIVFPYGDPNYEHQAHRDNRFQNIRENRISDQKRNGDLAFIADLDLITFAAYVSSNRHVFQEKDSLEREKIIDRCCSYIFHRENSPLIFDVFHDFKPTKETANYRLDVLDCYRRNKPLEELVQKNAAIDETSFHLIKCFIGYDDAVLQKLFASDNGRYLIIYPLNIHQGYSLHLDLLKENLFQEYMTHPALGMRESARMYELLVRSEKNPKIKEILEKRQSDASCLKQAILAEFHANKKRYREDTSDFKKKNPNGFYSHMRSLYERTVTSKTWMDSITPGFYDDMLSVDSIARQNAFELHKLYEQHVFYTSVSSLFRSLEDADFPVCRPVILEKEERRMRLQGAHNLHVACKTADVTKSVPNDFTYTPETNIFVLTGANSGGKTTSLLTVGLAQYFAARGLYVLAQEAEISLVDALYTHFLRSDGHNKQGQGTYAQELERAMKILDHATPYSLVLVDEPFSGTGYQEGRDASFVFLDKIHELSAPTYFTTHLHEIGEQVELGRYAGAANLCAMWNDDLQKPTWNIQENTRATTSHAVSVGITKENLNTLLEERRRKKMQEQEW